MDDQDKKRFMAALNGLGTAFKTQVSQDHLKLFWALFHEFQIDDFEAACFQFLKTGRFFPAPAELFELIPAANSVNHVGAQEAWSICVESMDEFKTVVITQEILDAKVIANDVWMSGDKIGARMAFIEAYERIVKTASKPKWTISHGFDVKHREIAIDKAIQLGRLPESSRLKLVAPEMTISALIADAKERDPSIKENCLNLIHSTLDSDVIDKSISEREKQRKEFEKHRNEELEKVKDGL